MKEATWSVTKFYTERNGNGWHSWLAESGTVQLLIDHAQFRLEFVRNYALVKGWGIDIDPKTTPPALTSTAPTANTPATSGPICPGSRLTWRCCTPTSGPP